jgi:hypoxanthine phosphoribosyltransferase
LLDKPARRVEKLAADYVGFTIPDLFVVGYGLDFAERYRNLPFVGVLHPHIYKEASASADLKHGT